MRQSHVHRQLLRNLPEALLGLDRKRKFLLHRVAENLLHLLFEVPVPVKVAVVVLLFVVILAKTVPRIVDSLRLTYLLKLGVFLHLLVNFSHVRVIVIIRVLLFLEKQSVFLNFQRFHVIYFLN